MHEKSYQKYLAESEAAGVGRTLSATTNQLGLIVDIVGRNGV